MPNELVTISSAAEAVSAVGRATSVVINAIRMHGIASAAARQRLRDEVAAARRYEVSGHLMTQALANMNHVFDLYDRADQYAGQPGKHESALRIAAQANRLLEENLARLARELA
ncbi:hypothetical protein [Microbacterium sp. SSM24]|uniref:hypothetical protein n=1 Tax=Microbacterium sp. SSM24 TaxID=2991714 RepID=UPI002225F712|nr:hypothetical protein [Microbacterium sp. SSM24]MCW3492264.1 hypothetical protein [Microbacterium sp. SSM24]